MLRYWLVWLVVLRINVDLAIFQPYLDLEAGDNQSLKIQVARPGMEPRSSCFASQELNHSATAAPMLRYNSFKCTVSVSWPDTSYHENWPGQNPISIVYFNRNETYTGITLSFCLSVCRRVRGKVKWFRVHNLGSLNWLQWGLFCPVRTAPF